jgi:hypothetical protein
MRANSFNTGIASEYLILSILYRLELEAYLSQGNKKSIDIRVIRKDGTPISIDVKSVRGYSSLVVNNIESKQNHFIIFVIYNNKFEQPEYFPNIYIVPSEFLKNITEDYNGEKRVLKTPLSSYKSRWEFITNDYILEGDNGFGEESPEQKIIATYLSSITLLNECNLTLKEVCEYIGITLSEYEELKEKYNQLISKLDNK